MLASFEATGRASVQVLVSSRYLSGVVHKNPSCLAHDEVFQGNWPGGFACVRHYLHRSHQLFAIFICRHYISSTFDLQPKCQNLMNLVVT